MDGDQKQGRMDNFWKKQNKTKKQWRKCRQKWVEKKL